MSYCTSNAAIQLAAHTTALSIILQKTKSHVNLLSPRKKLIKLAKTNAMHSYGVVLPAGREYVGMRVGRPCGLHRPLDALHCRAVAEDGVQSQASHRLRCQIHTYIHALRIHALRIHYIYVM